MQARTKINPSWQELVAIEPRLELLLKRAKQHKDDRRRRYFCANEVWYGYGPYYGLGLKGVLVRLVGFNAGQRHPRLITPEAYDVAYDTVYDALPYCRNCSCP
jgi:hypothetical protein